MWSKMYVGLHIMYRLFLSYFNETNSFGRFSKNTQLQIFMKICRLGAELLHTDGRDKANSRFSQLCERACHWLCAVLCLCLHLVVAAVPTGNDCLVMSSSGAEDKPWKLIVKFHAPSISRLFKIAICEPGWARSLAKIGMLSCVGFWDKCCLLGECRELMRRLCGTWYNCTCAAAQHTNIYTKSNSCEWTRVLCVLKVYSWWLKCVCETLHWPSWHVVRFRSQQLCTTAKRRYRFYCHQLFRRRIVLTGLLLHKYLYTCGSSDTGSWQANTKRAVSNSSGSHFLVFPDMFYKSNVMGKKVTFVQVSGTCRALVM